MPALAKIYEEYKDRVAFFVVYITEAHPTDIWQMPSNIRDGVLYQNPTTFAERLDVASSCVRNPHIPFPALIDGIENKVEQRYTGWPDRLYLIDKEGIVRFQNRTRTVRLRFETAGDSANATAVNLNRRTV